MATINEVIAVVGETKPNLIEDERKARVLLELEGKLYRELVAPDEPDRDIPVSYPEDGDKPLLVPEPYAVLYELYLTMWIEFWMREYGNYNNTAQLYAQKLADFRAAYRRAHVPKCSARVRL